MNTTISEKTYPGIYRELLGKNIKSSISLYNESLVSSAEENEQMIFLVFTNHEQIRTDEKYIILGIGHPKYYLNFIDSVFFVYTVNLIEDELYYQNSASCCLYGKVTQIMKYKFNFDYTDIQKKGNTCLNLIETIKYNTDNRQLETYAVKCLNIKLLKNIFRYKNTSYGDYDIYFKEFYKVVLDKLKITNPNRHKLRQQLNSICSFQNLVLFIKSNRDKILDNSDLLYNRNDNIQNRYPINMAGGNITLNLYDNDYFNSSLPFYFQYRNYQQSTEILADCFFNDIFSKENAKIINSLNTIDSILNSEKYTSQKVDTTKYGLYFPLLMSFRQSVELAYKLIFVNEDLKKQNIPDKKSLKDYVEKIKSHSLPVLLHLIKQFLSPDIYGFMLELSSFIYYNERTDASFSRYLLNMNLTFDDLKPIQIYYEDLYHYIKEFYAVMDEILTNINLGFDINKVFTS